MLGRHVYRVTPNPHGAWTVRKDGEDGNRGERRSRQDALDFACDLAAQDEPSKVVVESGDGKIEEERVFGVDQGQLVEGSLPDEPLPKGR